MGVRSDDFWDVYIQLVSFSDLTPCPCRGLRLARLEAVGTVRRPPNPSPVPPEGVR